MKIVSIAVSRKKGTRKTLVDRATVIENHGLDGDAHAGDWHRQVSFLASDESSYITGQVIHVNGGLYT